MKKKWKNKKETMQYFSEEIKCFDVLMKILIILQVFSINPFVIL